MSTARLLGRNTAGTGAIEEITLGTNLSFPGTTLNATGGGSANARWLSAGEFIRASPTAPVIDSQVLYQSARTLTIWRLIPALRSSSRGHRLIGRLATTFTRFFYWTAASGSGAVVWRAAALLR